MELTSLHAHFAQLSSRIKRSSDDASAAVARLSSGHRLTRAADDVAALSISTRMSSSISGLRSASINISQAMSLLDVADAGLSNISDILQRGLALSSMANADTLTNSERGFLNQELQGLMSEVERIATRTNFNSINVLDGQGEVKEEIVTEDGITLDGTVNADTLEGEANNDIITGFDGDDEIYAMGGDDTIQAGLITNPGLQGQIYQSAGGIGNLAAAEAIVASQPVWANFVSTDLNYPNQSSTIGNLLGGDAASLDNPAAAATVVNRMVFVWTGQITVDTAGAYNFGVGSDDGFNLQIDGVTELQFPNNRGFSYTNGIINLTAGVHDIRLLYWENGGGEGMIARSNIEGALSSLDSDILSYGANLTDGNDTIYAGEGVDYVTYEGIDSDYTIVELDDGVFRVTDNRPNSPNGTDIIHDAEFLRFSNTDIDLSELASSVTLEDELDGVLRFNIEDLTGTTFDYDIVDSTLAALFEDPSVIRIDTRASAEQSYQLLSEAVDRNTQMRAYVGSLRSQAGIISDALSYKIHNEDAARAVLADTDIAITSSDLAQAFVKNNMSISLAAQANSLRDEVVTSIYDRALEVGNISV